MEKYKVLLVEDDPLASQLIEIFINNSGRYTLEKSINSASMVGVYLIKNKIDLILMDVCTAFNANGLDAVEKIKKDYPDIKIIIIGATISLTNIFSNISRSHHVSNIRRNSTLAF